MFKALGASYNHKRTQFEQQKTDKGAGMEALTIALLGHCGIEGMDARPSFERQDVAKGRVDGLSYRWDVTVLSDGSTIEAGEYRVQVKSSDYFEKSQYHPDIALVYGNQVLEMPTKKATPLFQFGEELTSTPDVRYNEQAHRICCNLLDILQATGPAADLPIGAIE